MANKKKQVPPMLANFGTVASRVKPNRIIEEASEENINIDSIEDIDINNNINNVLDSKKDIEEGNLIEKAPEIKGTKSILNEVSKLQKAKKKRQMLVYLDSEVAEAMDAFARDHGKGAKSELVNKLLRNVFDLD